MEINKFLSKVNFTKGNNRKIEWLVIHYTANNGDTAWANCNYFYEKDRQASAHYFVDENKVWQCVEDENIAWHCGTKTPLNECRNANSIGVELCSRKDANGLYYFKEETVENAIELGKEIMKKYNIDINHVCRHYDVSGKVCPEPYVRNEQAWIEFKKRLLEEKKMTKEEQIKIIQEKAGLDDNTMKYLQFYRYGDALIEKLAKAMK